MARRRRGEIRRSQVITTYGIGSVVPVEDESFIVAGIEQWDSKDSADLDIHEPVLERQLGVDGFVAPPASEDGGDLPVRRFPVWVYCPTCKRLADSPYFGSIDKNVCGLCEEQLVPSRFVAVCEHGHIQDFPYMAWVHEGKRISGTHELRIEAGGESASLRDILITCSCKAERNMYGALGRNSLAMVGQKCRGRRPWLVGVPDESCDNEIRGLQRGASNVWFPVVRSALSIPPWSETVQKMLGKHWPVFKDFSEGLAPEQQRSALQSFITKRKLPVSVDALMEAVNQRRAHEDASDHVQDADIRYEEYQAIINGRGESNEEVEFVAERVHAEPHALSELIDHVSVVKRLREVRALQAFTRLSPPSPADPSRNVKLSANSDEHWLPAVTVLGEGVFFRLAEPAVVRWERVPEVKQRVAVVRQYYDDMFKEHGTTPDREITPRLMLIHALAHALIRQWALDAGYPEASLRERLYTGPSMLGVLIYTAASDSAGSLGGITELAESDDVWRTVQSALRGAEWCSSDPVCIESGPGGANSLNIAACHACALLPEVSCEESNLLLDRAMLVGTPDCSELGFFSEELGTV